MIKYKTTWRIFTPYIKNCSLSGTSLSCGSYWNQSGAYLINTFTFEGKEVRTKCRQNICGITIYRNKCFRVSDNNMLEMKVKNFVKNFVTATQC